MNTLWMERRGSMASVACAAHRSVLAAKPSIISVLGLNVLSHRLSLRQLRKQVCSP